MIKVCKVSDDAKVLYCTINKNKLDYKVIDGFCKKHDLKYVIGYDWLKKETWEDFERLCSNSSFNKKEIITQALKDFMKTYKNLL